MRQRTTSKRALANGKTKKAMILVTNLPIKVVEAIAGIGLVKLGKWLEARQKNYKKLMNRVHKMIVAVTIAEKDERKKIHSIQKVALGYDTLKWMKGDANVRGESQLGIDYLEVKLITPTKGNHKCTQRQKLYEEVHNFIGKENGCQ